MVPEPGSRLGLVCSTATFDTRTIVSANRTVACSMVPDSTLELADNTRLAEDSTQGRVPDNKPGLFRSKLAHSTSTCRSKTDRLLTIQGRQQQRRSQPRAEQTDATSFISPKGISRQCFLQKRFCTDLLPRVFPPKCDAKSLSSRLLLSFHPARSSC